MPRAKINIQSNTKTPTSRSFFCDIKKRIDYNEDLAPIEEYLAARASIKKGKKKSHKTNKNATNSTISQEKEGQKSVCSDQQFDQFNELNKRSRGESMKRTPKVNKEKRKSYGEELIDFIFNKNIKMPQYVSKEEHLQSLESLKEILSYTELDSDIPPYYIRLTNVQQEINELMEEKENLGPLTEENLYPMLLPQEARLTNREKQRITKLDEGGEEKKPRSLEKKELKKSSRDLERFTQEDIMAWSVEHQNSQYIVSKVVHKPRQKSDLPEYLETGLKRLDPEKSFKILSFDSFFSLQKFNFALQCDFLTLNRDYFRSMDERNEGFSGMIRLDEEYQQQFPYEDLFPELTEIFKFPVLEPGTSSSEEDSKVMREAQDQSDNANQILNAEDIQFVEEKYNQVYNEQVIEYEKFKKLARYFYFEAKQFRRENSEIMHHGEHCNQSTTNWDYYVTIPRDYEGDDYEEESSKIHKFSSEHEFQSQINISNSSQSKSKEPSPFFSKTQTLEDFSKTKTISVKNLQSKRIESKLNDIPNVGFKISKRETKPDQNQDDQNLRQQGVGERLGLGGR